MFDLAREGVSSRPVKNLLLKRSWNCHGTDYVMARTS